MVSGRYQHGAAFEVYPMVLSAAFEGLRFDLAAVGLCVAREVLCGVVFVPFAVASCGRLTVVVAVSVSVSV